MKTEAELPTASIASNPIPRLLGFQLADPSGINIQGDDNDPLNLTSFQIMTPAYATKAMEKLGHNTRYLLMPIFDGDVEDPHLIGPTASEPNQCPNN